jgi:hypothetical protein
MKGELIDPGSGRHRWDEDEAEDVDEARVAGPNFRAIVSHARPYSVRELITVPLKLRGAHVDVFHAPHFVEWTVNVLFFFWLTPLGMALFLDLDFERFGFADNSSPRWEQGQASPSH